eukprot:scaffold178405_cov30-Tisochrysis_lutea.AAC.7
MRDFKESVACAWTSVGSIHFLAVQERPGLSVMQAFLSLTVERTLAFAQVNDYTASGGRFGAQPMTREACRRRQPTASRLCAIASEGCSLPLSQQNKTTSSTMARGALLLRLAGVAATCPSDDHPPPR